jgi:hypothetical protein
MYAEPRTVTDPTQCRFYHAIDLPEGMVGGDWDHREDIQNYLGDIDFHGKRVLDVGTAGGLLSFAMEHRGADVVSFDIDDAKNWDFVPHYKADVQGRIRNIQKFIEPMKDGYWYAHRALKSRAKVHYGNLYNLPDELGKFDIAMYGLILTHLREPFMALAQGAKLVRDTMIVTGMYAQSNRPTIEFRPSKDEPYADWWFVSMPALENMLGALGFGVEKVVESKAMLNVTDNAGPRTMQTIVAKRFAD